MNASLQTDVKKFLNYLFCRFQITVSITALFLLSLVVSDIKAQENVLQFTTTLTASEGLSLNVVTRILQDSRGFLWLGTYNGLNRYDGYNFKVFLPEPNNLQSISNYSILCIFEDSNGNIWIGTRNGLNRYDWRTEKFKRFLYNSNNPNSNIVMSIFEDKSGTLWIGSANGLFKYDRAKETFSVSYKVSSLINEHTLNSVTTMEEDKDGNMWLGTWNGLTCIKKDGGTEYVSLPIAINQNMFRYNQISKIVADNANNIWIGTNTNQGLYRYNLDSKKFTVYYNIASDPGSISDNSINTIYKDNSNHLWIGTQNGLNKYDAKQDRFTQIVNDPLSQFTIVHNNVNDIIQDRTGLFWIATARGISRAHETNNIFSFIDGNISSAKRLSGSRVETIQQDRKGNVFIGTRGGLDKIIPASNTILRYKNEPGNKNSLNDNDVRSVVEDKTGIIWIGTGTGGLNSFDPQTGTYQSYKYDPKDTTTLSNNGVISLCIDRHNNVWAGTWWGLNLFDRATGKFERFTNFKIAAIWVVFEDSKGTIWLGTDGGGLIEFNPVTKTYDYYLSESTDYSSICGNRVISIFESADGLLWFGTTEGLNAYDRKSKRFFIYKKENGLPSSVINSIIEDDNGFIWISTDKGLSKFDRKKEAFKNYNEKDGLQEIEFTPNAAIKTPNGELYFGSRSGVVHFYPAKIIDDALKAPVAFTDLKIYNKSVPIASNGGSILNESITIAREIKIPYNSNVITFEFALLDYFDVKRNRFRYKLEGFDNSWNEIGTRNTATYTNIPPGEYTFVVRGSIDAGYKNEKEASLKIVIVPEFYQTTWFKVSLSAGLLLIIIFYFQIKTNSIKKQNVVLENKVAERTQDLDKTINELNQEIATKDKFFSIIAHDLRGPFTALLGFSRCLVDELDELSKEELKEISESILRSAGLTYGLLENLLHWARIQTGKIEFNPVKINLKDILNVTTELYKGNAYNKDIDIIIHVDGSEYANADIHMVETVLRNLISNSIKFTSKGGKVIISAEDEERHVRIKVRDTGVGLNEDQIEKLFKVGQNISTPGTDNEKGSGLGLILCREFVEFNKGTISVTSAPGEGTEFSFTLPKYAA